MKLSIPPFAKPTPLALRVLIALSLPLSQSAMAETLELSPVNVWGTEVNASSVRVSEDTLLIKQADHISDLLRPLPGVDVGGAHSLNQRITIRSMDDKDLQVSIDGARQNAYMYHHMGNLQIHADILESVDVNIGTNSVLDGGLGGSVRLQTKSAAQLLREGARVGAHLRATYGDNSGDSVAATGFAQLTDSLDMLAYFNALSRDNYAVGGEKILDFNGQEIPNTDGTVRGLEGDLSDMLFKLGWDINASQRLSVGVERYRDEGDYSYRPDMGLATDLAITDSLGVPLLWPTEFTRDTLTLNYEWDLSEHTYVNATAYRNLSELWRDERGWANNAQFAASAGTIEGEALNTGVNVLAETEIGHHLLSYGVELNNYDTDYRANLTSGDVRRADEQSRDTALYAQDRIQVTDSVAVTPGLRFDRQKLDSSLTDDTFSKWTAALAVDWAINDSLQLRASTTSLFKAPEIGEVFIGAGLDDTANPDIDAETGSNTELSLAFEQSLMGADRFAAGVTAFQTQIDDYIYDYAPTGVGRARWKDNVGDMQVDGFEAYLGYDRGQLKTLLTFAKADSELEAFDNYSAFDGARLDRKQGDSVSLNVDYLLPETGVTLHWDTQWVDDLSAGVDLDGATANNAKDGYTVHNVSARWQPQQYKGLSLTLGVDNLLDEFYASQSSRTGLSRHPRFGDLYLQDYEPGRNVKFTVSYQF